MEGSKAPVDAVPAVIEGEVEAPERADGALDQGLYLGGPGQIGEKDHGLTAGLLHGLGGLLGLGLATGGENDLGPIAPHEDSRGSADSRARSGDDASFAF